MAENEFLHAKELTVKRTYTATLPPTQHQEIGKFVLKSEYATGEWANAIAATLDYGTTGSAHGTAATASFDMTLPNQAFPSGEYQALYLGINPQASSTWGAGAVNPVSFMKMEVWGTTGEFLDKGYVLDIRGVEAAAAGHIFDTIGSTTPTHELRIKIDGVNYFIMLQATQ